MIFVFTSKFCPKLIILIYEGIKLEIKLTRKSISFMKNKQKIFFETLKIQNLYLLSFYSSIKKIKSLERNIFFLFYFSIIFIEHLLLVLF